MKNKYIKLIKRISSIKWENLFLAIAIPITFTHTMKANPGMLIPSIIIDFTLFGGFTGLILFGRKEALKSIKEGTFEPLMDFDEIEEQILSIQTFLQQKKNKFGKLLSNNHTRKQLAFQKRSINELYNN